MSGTLKDFVCTDVRLDFISLECHPVADRDAVLSIAVRDDEDGLAVAAGLGREDARALADHIIEVLSRESCSTGMCDHFIEIGDDPWAGTYCKLPAGHDGPCSPLYPDEVKLGEGRA